MNRAAAYLIKILHIALVLFVLFGHLTQDPLVLLVYLGTLLSLRLHWWLSNDVCFLTLVEKSLLGVDNKSSFMHNLVSPVYKIEDKDLSTVSKWVVDLLIIFTLWKFWSLKITPRYIYSYIRDQLQQNQ